MWYVMEGIDSYRSEGGTTSASDELFFLHYKLPSSHPEQRDHFEERDNGIPPEWLDASYGRRAAPTAPRSGSSAPQNPEWKRIMQRNEWRPPTNG